MIRRHADAACSLHFATAYAADAVYLTLDVIRLHALPLLMLLIRHFTPRFSCLIFRRYAARLLRIFSFRRVYACFRYLLSPPCCFAMMLFFYAAIAICCCHALSPLSFFATLRRCCDFGIRSSADYALRHYAIF